LTANRSPTGDYFLLDDAEVGPRANWQAIFGNSRPVQVEIGPGKGTTLLQLARLFPQHNFLGLEWARQFCRNCARRARFWSLTNIKMLRADAREFIIDRVPTESILAVHVYFPDPWPKKRHHKRRLFIPELCHALARTVTRGGKVIVATDHEEYFGWIADKLLSTEVFQESSPNLLLDKDLTSVTSNYERKFRQTGRKIFRLAVEKV